MATCEACGADVLDIDVKCPKCGKPIASTGAHRMLGTVVLGAFELVDVLGQGGMSVVYKGRHRLTGQEAALKILPPELAAHAQVKSRFVEEARALAQLDHPNIVHLYNFDQETNGCFVLAMQFVQGKTWERLILEHTRLDWVSSATIAVDVLRALEYAHGRGVIHRDMKPSNVLVRADDGTATVMDFGIAKMTTSTRLTATGQTMGTVRYMSPEQVRGQEVDLRTDIYSLGATLYESIVGDTPFDGDTHFEIMTRHLNEPPKAPSVRGIPVPAELETALMRSLAKKPDDRFAAARDFRKALEAALKDADSGHSETLRMARGSIAQARNATGPRSKIGTRPPPTTGAPALDSITDLARELEPTGMEPALRRRPKPWLWLGLGGVVAVSGIAVLIVSRGGGEARATAAAAAAGSGTGSAAVRAFEPPDVTWIGSVDVPERQIVIRTAAPWDPKEIAAAHGRITDHFQRFLTARSPDARLAPLPMTVLVVPKRVLCDRRTYDGAMPERCDTNGSYYRPIEQTLLVADDKKALDRNLATGIAEAACLHEAAPGACEARDPFVQEVARGGPP